MNKVYVYGTLRPNKGPTIQIRGDMYDLGWYPGVVNLNASENTFEAEVLVVGDKELDRLDQYEGYYPDDPSASLYLRQPLMDGFIYVYNRDVFGYPRVEGGNWLSYRESLKLNGSALDIDIDSEGDY
jgi:gamma-glutamylcyclotransferase (GGCT)/AIG2-like uncharacterized protein YtfP